MTLVQQVGAIQHWHHIVCSDGVELLFVLLDVDLHHVAGAHTLASDFARPTHGEHEFLDAVGRVRHPVTQVSLGGLESSSPWPFA